VPLQNRVTPYGEIVATPERGTLFGNRGGRFHHPTTRILFKRRFVSRRWICCELAFKGRSRAVFGQGYTELFFLDEATALAAGHRPCFECRRADALRFRDAFALGNGLTALALADEMDARLHAERLAPRPRVVGWRELPDGAMIGNGREAWLIVRGLALLWNAAGYRARRSPHKGKAAELRLLTPSSIVAALRAGFAPRLHETATRPARG
jgi:hypothetical protein